MLANRVRMGSKTKGGPMPFIVGDIIPSTTQLKVSWNEGTTYSELFGVLATSDNGNYEFIANGYGGSPNNHETSILEWPNKRSITYVEGWMYSCGLNGDESCQYTPFILADTTPLSEAERTIFSVNDKVNELGFAYEEV